MVKQVLLKLLCTTLFSIFSLTCSNSVPSAPLVRLPHLRQPVNLKEGLNQNTQPELASQWYINVMKDREDLWQRENYVLGYDFTEQEMKQLKLWPKGVVPYYIDARSFSDKVLRDRIRGFLNVVNGFTSLNFMELPSPPKDDTTRWVFFINRRGLLGCADHSIKNFTNAGVQQVVLGYDCMSTGGELAEAVLAIAGVPPQHNAPDRDNYIKVVDENILPEKKYLFEKLNNDEWLFHDIKYDFSSAGHYHYHKYSANGRATINTKDRYLGTAIGEAHGFSASDMLKLRILYNYISNKNEDQLPECNKLFVRGTKFNTLSRIQDEIKPRKKPNKYLGLPEEVVEEEKVIDNSTDPTKITSKEENYDGKSNDDNDKSYHQVPHGNSEESETIPSNVQLLKKKVKQAFKRDPISYLSDYSTGDDMYAKNVAKNVGEVYKV